MTPERWHGQSVVSDAGKKRGQATFLAVSVNALGFGAW